MSALLLIKSAQLECFLTLSGLQGQQPPDHCILILNRKNIIIGAAFNTFLEQHLPILHSFHQKNKLTIIWWPHAVSVEKHQEVVQQQQEVVQQQREVIGILLCVVCLLCVILLLNRTSQLPEL